MHAVLLAAGVGRRLTDITGGGPKCLLPFGGASLLERHLVALAAVAVHRLTIVTGCESMQIEQALGALAPVCAPQMTIDTVFNADFRAGSALSVLTARDRVAPGDDMLLMDADVLYDAAVLRALVDSGHDNALLYDRDFEAGDEPVKLCLRDGLTVGFGKQPPADLACDTIGESVGFFRFAPGMAEAVFHACARAAEADSHAPHEQAIRAVLLAEARRFAALDITGSPWIEIDYPADIDRAVDMIEPRLQAATAG